jgi:membrane protein
LLATANGIFMPLEVAFNRIWGIQKNRNFISNQVISQGLIFGCGILWLAASLASSPVAKIGWLGAIVYKVASVPITAGIVFLTYWLLPNAKIPAPLVAVAAVVVALAIETLKLVNLLIWPWLYSKLRHEYGPFVHAVTILTWSFLFSMLVLAGAEWSARKAKELGLVIEPREA